MGIETDNIIKKLFESFLKNYQKNLEEKMKDSNFVFESVDLLYYSLHKTKLKRGKSYIKSPKWLTNKGATINPKTKYNKCFRDSAVASLNHERIPNPPGRISNLEPFFDQYNWKGIEFPPPQKTGKSLNKIIRQLLLISYLYHTILNK